MIWAHPHMIVGAMACLSTTMSASQVSWHTASSTHSQEGCQVPNIGYGLSPSQGRCCAWGCARPCSLQDGCGPGSRMFPPCPHAFTCPECLLAWCATATINQPATRSVLAASERQGKGFDFSCSALRASALTFELCYYFLKGQKSSQWFIVITTVRCMPKGFVHPYRRKQKPSKLVFLDTILWWAAIR